MGCPPGFGGLSSSETYTLIKGAKGAVDHLLNRTREPICLDTDLIRINTDRGAPSAPSVAGVVLSCANVKYERGQLACAPPAPNP